MKKLFILLLLSNLAFCQQATIGIISNSSDTIRTISIPPPQFYRLYTDGVDLFGVKWDKNRVRLTNQSLFDDDYLSNSKKRSTAIITNAGIGYKSLYNTENSNSSAVGYKSQESVLSSNNSSLGAYSLNVNNLGNNVALGAYAGQNATGAGNVFIGYRVGDGSSSYNNRLLIDNKSTNLPFIDGDIAGGVLTVRNQLNTEIISTNFITSLQVKSPDVANCIRLENYTLQDSSLLTHGLGTTKLDIEFYNTNGTRNDLVGWEPYALNNNQVKIYLPYRDKPTKYVFKGDVFIFKRKYP